jgi:hypothetical protein
MGAIYIHPKHPIAKDIWYVDEYGFKMHCKMKDTDKEEAMYSYLEAVMVSAGSGPKPKKHEWVNRDAELDIQYKNEDAMRRYV